ncbi:MAG TPA: hypothetical protein VF712_04980 [Thermoleophilaceae bacterium]|jgi:hypothetical protein
MRSSDRLLVLFILLTVLVVALYTSRTATPGLGLAVALMALLVAYFRPVLGIPVALAMAAVAAIAPWAVLLVFAVAGLLTLATKAPEVASSQVDPLIGMSVVNGTPSIGDFGAGDGPF